MIVKLLTERHLEFLSLKGGCTSSSESTLVKMSNCWKSHAAAQLFQCHFVLFCSYYQIAQHDCFVITQMWFMYKLSLFGLDARKIDCLRGFMPSKTQTSLLSYKDKAEY